MTAAAAKRAGLVLAMLAAVLAAVFVLLALGAPGYALADEQPGNIGTLSNRYERLEQAGEQVDGSENVVVTTRIGVLAAANRALDGVTVSFSGEVVGDVMTADADHKWVNLLASDGSCVGVLVDNSMASRIKNVGDYSTTGTTLQVRGIYSVDCDEHQGELDVHAEDVRVLDAGGKIFHAVNEADVNVGLQLCLVAFVLLTSFFVARWYFARRSLRGMDD